MRKTCAQIVEYTGKQRGISGGLLSTLYEYSSSYMHKSRVQLVLFTKSFPSFPPYISPVRSLDSPPTEHYFYPVSTTPTNSYNQIN